MPTEICTACANFCEQDTKTFSKLKDLLPEGYQHLICKFCVTSGANDHFEATVRINLFSKEDVQKWKNSFQESSKVTLRIKRTYPALSTKIIYKVMYRCQHSTQPRSSTADARKGSKNTYCPATTFLTLYQTNIYDPDGYKRKSRSSDGHRADYPAIVQIKHCHNHAIIAASAIKHRDVSEKAKLRLEQLMLQGYAPSAALEMYKYDLYLEHGDDYVYISADRALCPDRAYVYRLFYKLEKEKYGKTRGESQIPQLKEFDDGCEVNGQEMGALRKQQYTSEQVDHAAEDECSLDIEEAADIDNAVHSECITDKEQVNDSSSLLADLQDFVKLCEHKLAADPVTFGPGLKAFMQNFRKIKTDTHLVNAFHTFGKYTGVSLTTGKRRIIFNKKIGIQPTSLQMRQRAVPGLKRQGAGCPKKAI